VRRFRVASLVVAGAFSLLLAGCGSVGHSEGAGDAQNGRQLFIEGCGSCHTLADAGTTGEIGPNLDDAFFQFRVDATGARNEDGEVDLAGLSDPDAESTIQDVVRGQIAYPIVDPSTGAPGMPADIYTGDDADDVAAYVASVAGLQPPGDRGGTPAPSPPPPPPPSGGGQPPPAPGPDDQLALGKDVFVANCAPCHTLADAGTSGTVGPNLDDVQPSAATVKEMVTNGRGAMPSFSGQLSEEEIDAVADYVSTVAGG
jgi:mono/diheme cytochrome c family protein